MTPRSIELVRQTWVMLLPDAEHVGVIFYDRLFAADASVAALFANTDIAAPCGKLLDTLGLAVQNAHHLADMQGALEDLGRRHVAYGTRDEHYGLVRDALIETLAETLGDAFTFEARAAWVELYAEVSGPMRSAANTLTQEAA